MKRIMYVFFLLAIVAGGCKKDETKPETLKPNACITADNTVVDTKTRVDFSASCSANAKKYSWNFGDGTTGGVWDGLSTAEHTYTQPGTYTATVTVSNEDGTLSDQKSITIKVGERYVSKIVVKDLNFLNGSGQPWDEDGSGPDVYFNFSKTNGGNGGFTTFKGYDIKQSQLPINFTPQNPTDWKLSDEDMSVLLADFDGPELYNFNTMALWQEVNFYSANTSPVKLAGNDQVKYDIEVYWEIR